MLLQVNDEGQGLARQGEASCKSRSLPETVIMSIVVKGHHPFFLCLQPQCIPPSRACTRTRPMAGGCTVSTDFVHSEAAGLCHTEPAHTLVTAVPGMGNSPRLCQGVSEGAHTLNLCLISNHSLLSSSSAKQRHCQTFNHIKKSFNKLGSS